MVWLSEMVEFLFVMPVAFRVHGQDAHATFDEQDAHATLFGADSEAAGGAFADGFCMEVRFCGELCVYHATLVCSHRSKQDNSACFANLGSRMFCHRREFGFACRTEIFNIANKALPFRHVPAKYLACQ